jgi:DNA-directed RNA polymerase I, II, and III subunit RPABC2
MPPKKLIIKDKIETVRVDTADVEQVDDTPKEPVAKSKKIISIKKKPIPIPVILENEIDLGLDKKEDVDEVKPDIEIKQEDIQTINEDKNDSDVNPITETEVKPKPILKKTMDKSKSESEIGKTSIVKSKKTVSKKIETNIVDKINDDDIDYRTIIMNYDVTKNKTLPKITKYEKALLIGKRAKQIEEGANPNVRVLTGQSAVEIAEEELKQRKIPLIIKRPNGNTFEYWKPIDMEVTMD